MTRTDASLERTSRADQQYAVGRRRSNVPEAASRIVKRAAGDHCPTPIALCRDIYWSERGLLAADAREHDLKLPQEALECAAANRANPQWREQRLSKDRRPLSSSHPTGVVVVGVAGHAFDGE